MRNGKYLYSIKMTVPIGFRYGRLELNIHGDTVGGALTLFGQTRPILNGIFKDGNIRFAGEMKTLMYALLYTAAGTVNETSLNLNFRTGKGCFPATGAAAEIIKEQL